MANTQKEENMSKCKKQKVAEALKVASESAVIDPNSGFVRLVTKDWEELKAACEQLNTTRYAVAAMVSVWRNMPSRDLQRWYISESFDSYEEATALLEKCRNEKWNVDRLDEEKWEYVWDFESEVLEDVYRPDSWEVIEVDY